MRAAVFKGVGMPWAVEVVPDPTPGHGEMVVRVKRCGICGTDVHTTSGRGGTMPSDCVLGHEYAGEVVALGNDANGFAIGDRVAAMPFSGCGACRYCVAGDQILCERGPKTYLGGFAEYVRVSAANAVRLPPHLSYEDGALIEPLAVGLHAARMASTLGAERILILGAGPIGLAVMLALRRDYDGRLVAMARTDRRHTIALAMGADEFVLSGEDERSRVVSALSGAPDIVFECVGLPGAINIGLRHVRPNGTVVSLGYCVEQDRISTALATTKQARMAFSVGYSIDDFTEIASQLAGGSLACRAMVSQTIGLETVGKAIQALDSGTSDAIKIQIDPGRLRE